MDRNENVEGVSHSSYHLSDERYRRRFLVSLVIVLAVGIALVRWWPGPTLSPPDIPFADRVDDRIQVRDVQTTTQSRELTPPPPAPLPPVVVPNDEIIEEPIEFGDASLTVEDPGDDDRLQQGNSNVRTASRQPDTNPRLFRAVQPEYPREARKEEVRARVEVAVRVSKTGRVQEATITKRWQLSPDGSTRPVAQLQYGLEKAAVAAARRSRFRPAVHDGTPVESQTTLTFEFGPQKR